MKKVEFGAFFGRNQARGRIGIAHSRVRYSPLGGLGKGHHHCTRWHPEVHKGHHDRTQWHLENTQGKKKNLFVHQKIQTFNKKGFIREHRKESM